MRALAAALLVVTGSAGCSNPCADARSGETCVVLTVKGSLHTLQQLFVSSSIAGAPAKTQYSPMSAMGNYSLPFDVGLIYAAGEVGDVVLTADGVVDGAFKAEGMTFFSLDGVTSRLRATVILDGTPMVPDMATAPPDLTPPSTDMATLVTTKLVAGSFDAVVSSDNVIAAITHSNQTLQIYDTSGTLQISLDSGASVNALYVTDNLVVYCVNPVAIGTTGNQSCTLKAWKPGSANATQLGSGVYPFAAGFSPDGNTIAWRQNVDATATKADVIASINGTQTTLATQLPLAASWFYATTGAVYATVPGTGAQIDIARLTTAPAVHICQNCDQFVLSSDLSQIAARAAVAGNLGKVVVGATSINTLNGLGTLTPSPNADVSRLIDFYPGRVMYVSASGSSYNLIGYDTAANSVTMRDTGIKSIWFTTPDMVAFSSITRNSDGTGDLWLVSKTSGSDVIFSAGPGRPWDYTADDYFTFNEQPAGGAPNFFVTAGQNVSATALFTLKMPSSDAVFLDASHIVCFQAADKLLVEDFTVDKGFLFNATIVDFDVDRAKKRLLFVLSEGSARDGIHQYLY
jgi:hypothetical protein